MELKSKANSCLGKLTLQSFTKPLPCKAAQIKTKSINTFTQFGVVEQWTVPGEEHGITFQATVEFPKFALVELLAQNIGCDFVHAFQPCQRLNSHKGVVKHGISCVIAKNHVDIAVGNKIFIELAGIETNSPVSLHQGISCYKFINPHPVEVPSIGTVL